MDFGSFKNVPVKSRGLRRIVIACLLKNAEFQAPLRYATDYFDTLVTTKRLEFLVGNEADYSCAILTPLLERPESVQVTVRLVTEQTTSALEQWTKGKAFTDCADVITSLNVLSQRNLSHSNNAASGIMPPLLKSSDVPSTHWQKAGVNKYFRSGERFPSSSDGQDLGGGMHWRRGFFASIRPGEGKVLLNVNVATSAFFNMGTLADFWASMPRQHDQLGLFQDLVKGLQVRLMYVPAGTEKNPGGSPQRLSTGNLRSQGSLRKVFQAELKDTYPSDYTATFRPLLNSQWKSSASIPLINICDDRNPYWVPAELLWIEPDQPVKGLLNSTQTPGMINGARRIPSQNRDFVIGQAMEAIGRTSLSGDFGFDIAPQLVEIGAQMLRIPDVYYDGGKSQAAQRTQSGQWNLAGMESSSAAQRRPRALTVIHLPGYQSRAKKAINIIDSLAVFLQKLRVSQPKYKELPGFNFQHLKAWWDKIAKNDRPDAVLVVLGDEHTDTYAGIKYFTDLYAGVPSVCVLANKVVDKSADAGFAANVSLKLNVQLGGTNQVVNVPFGAGSRPECRKCTMIVGADVTHPGPGSVPHCPSIAAIVASTDAEWTKYPGSIRLQSSKQEMIGDLEGMMTERLNAWSKANGGKVPENILFYRDGVSESQFALVKQHELPQIHAACAKATHKTGHGIKVTHLIVDKRHNTRFYAKGKDLNSSEIVDLRSTNARQNFLPGLVVDDHVTIPMCSDFYLQSHKALAGTARNSHYFVLENGIGLTMQELESITFSLCFLYARSTTSVSYATPAYYADRLCDRARYWLRGMLVKGSVHNHDVLVKGYKIPQHLASAARDAWAVNWASGYWRSTSRPAGDNTPWHQDLDDGMFYL